MGFQRRARYILRWGLTLVWIFIALPKLSAQAPGTEEVQQRISMSGLRPPAQNLPAGSSNLGEIKVVQEYAPPEMLTFDMTQNFHYTDNVFYTHTNPLGSTAYQANYAGSYVPYSLREWTPRITAAYNMTRYDTVPAGDFDNEQLIFSSAYAFGKGLDWMWNSSVDLSRYTAPHVDDHEYYREVIYDNGVNWVYQPDKETALYLVTGYDVAYHQSAPDVYGYLENGGTFKVAYYPTSTVSIMPYVNPSSRIFSKDTYYLIYNQVYHQQDRSDLHLAAGVDVTWTPIKYLLFTASVYHVSDYSNNSGLSFNYTIPGLSLTGEVKF